jgi:hypothetical protein
MPIETLLITFIILLALRPSLSRRLSDRTGHVGHIADVDQRLPQLRVQSGRIPKASPGKGQP